jgi:hypothetical protein
MAVASGFRGLRLLRTDGGRLGLITNQLLGHSSLPGTIPRWSVQFLTGDAGRCLGLKMARGGGNTAPGLLASPSLLAG